MRKVQFASTFLVTVLLCVNTAVPAFADEQTAPASYTVQYSQVEQMVLNNNLQVDSNERTVGSMDNENELKAKYEKLSDTVSQASASMAAIINNPQASADLKTLAQGTSVALSSVSAMLSSQKDISEDDYKLTELQANLSDYQLVKTAQSMFLLNYQLQYNIEQMANTRVTLQNAVKAAQSLYDLGKGTSVAVADAKAALSSLDNSAADLQNQSKSIGYQMNQLLGRSYNDNVTFGAMPAPDSAYVEKINLTNDISAAKDASYTVQIKQLQRSLISDDTSENRDQRQIKSNEAEMENQKIGASLENQYNTIKKQQSVLVLEQQKLADAQVKQKQAQKKYDVGVISAMELTKVRNDYLAQSTAVRTASATLFWQIETYKWIVKGLPAS
jgi:outer membrane protein TolC